MIVFSSIFFLPKALCMQIQRNQAPVRPTKTLLVTCIIVLPLLITSLRRDINE